jgi:hypothetical protein
MDSPSHGWKAGLRASQLRARACASSTFSLFHRLCHGAGPGGVASGRAGRGPGVRPERGGGSAAFQACGGAALAALPPPFFPASPRAPPLSFGLGLLTHALPASRRDRFLGSRLGPRADPRRAGSTDAWLTRTLENGHPRIHASPIAVSPGPQPPTPQWAARARLPPRFPRAHAASPRSWRSFPSSTAPTSHGVGKSPRPARRGRSRGSTAPELQVAPQHKVKVKLGEVEVKCRINKPHSPVNVIGSSPVL